MDQRVFLRLGAIALVAAVLAGCGRKGPLELPPDAPPPPASQAASEPLAARVSPAADNPGLIQPPNKYADRPVGEKLDQAARSPSAPINAPAAPVKKPFLLDPLL